MEQIKNDQLTLEISSLGAELQSIKDANGNEYLWDGDDNPAPATLLSSSLSYADCGTILTASTARNIICHATDLLAIPSLSS